MPGDQMSAPHPLFHAGRWILADLLSTLVFVGLYAATHSIYAATSLAIALGLGQIAYLKVRDANVDVMQWLSLGLVVVFGGATLLTDDPVFVMVKPTLIYAAIGAVMLRPGWMTRYIPPIARTRGGDVTTAFGYVWSGLFFATAAANLVLAMYARPETWVWFLGVFPLASKITLVGTQYATTRVIVRRRIRASAGAGMAAG